MRLVKRSDGYALNLDAGIAFREMKDDLLVEFPNEEFYIIAYMSMSDLDIDHTFKREFKGWPDNV